MRSSLPSAVMLQVRSVISSVHPELESLGQNRDPLTVDGKREILPEVEWNAEDMMKSVLSKWQHQVEICWKELREKPCVASKALHNWNAWSKSHPSIPQSFYLLAQITIKHSVEFWFNGNRFVSIIVNMAFAGCKFHSFSIPFVLCHSPAWQRKRPSSKTEESNVNNSDYFRDHWQCVWE